MVLPAKKVTAAIVRQCTPFVEKCLVSAILMWNGEIAIEETAGEVREVLRLDVEQRLAKEDKKMDEWL